MDAAADTADGGHRARHLLHGHALEEFLKAAEFHGLEKGVVHIAGIIKENGNLAMALKTGNWADFDFFHAAFSFCSATRWLSFEAVWLYR